MIEVVLGGMVLVVAITAILGAYIGQVTLNEHARNLSLATNDANRVIERIRQQNSPCPGTAPSITWPSDGSWDGWLGNPATGGGKSIQPNPLAWENVVVTCQAAGGGTALACDALPANTDPVRVTVAVCWRHRGRTIGECNWNGAILTPLEGANGFPNNADLVIESPVMLTTLVTCR